MLLCDPFGPNGSRFDPFHPNGSRFCGCPGKAPRAEGGRGDENSPRLALSSTPDRRVGGTEGSADLGVVDTF